MERRARRDIVVIGGSAGGVEALLKLSSRLPADLRAGVLAVIHSSWGGPGLLAQLVSRGSSIGASFAEDGEAIRYGQMLLAPPDSHLTVQDGCAGVRRGPRENGFRPAIDPLFRTAALNYGPRVIGVILSGALDDGAHGLLEIKRQGGMALVQHADEALFSSMPLAAIRSVDVDDMLPITDLAARIVAVAGHGKRDGSPAAPDRPVAQEDASSGFTCPQCGGALWEEVDAKTLRYRCSGGHRFAETTLLAHQANEVEGALWSGLYALEEGVALRQRMASHAIQSGLKSAARSFRDGANATEAKAERIRRVLMEAVDPS